MRLAWDRTVRQLVGAPYGNLVGQILRFMMVGAIFTVMFAVLFLSLQPILGPQLANLVALLVTGVGNVAANRSFTFGIRGRTGAVQHHLQGLVIFAVTWALTAGSLAALAQQNPDAPAELELAVLVAANLVGTAMRFLGLKMIFRTAVGSADTAEFDSRPRQFC